MSEKTINCKGTQLVLTVISKIEAIKDSVVVVANLRLSSVDNFALSCFLELWKPRCGRLWPELDVLAPSRYVDPPAVRSVKDCVCAAAVGAGAVMTSGACV